MISLGRDAETLGIIFKSINLIVGVVVKIMHVLLFKLKKQKKF